MLDEDRSVFAALTQGRHLDREDIHSIEQVLAKSPLAGDNLEAILAEAGTDWSRVLKTTVFLTDLGDFAAFNAVYERLLRGARPARSTVQVAALPMGVNVEIELIAAI